MSRGPSTSQFSSASDGFRAGRFDYANLRIQETLTTIRYGVEARKGWVVITGEAGVGKTTLLYKAATELSSNVTCIVESDPRVSFVEVVQLILRSLGVENGGPDEPTMTQTCQRELRSRLQKSQLVALMFDNAHHLSERTLRQVIKNFCGGSAEEPDGALLQLVLAGRPELKTNLSQAALLPLRRRAPIVCEVQPLSSREIGAYLELALRSNNRAAELFDARAIKRIALYTKGNPRAINALCEHAAQAAGGASVTAELIDEVARDLNLLQPPAADETLRVAKNFAEDLAPPPPPKTDFTHSRFPPSDTGTSGDYTSVLEAVGHTFADYRRGGERSTAAPTRVKRKSAWVSLMLLVIVLSGAAGWIGTGGAGDSLSGWTAMLNGFIAYLQETRNSTGETENIMKPRAETKPLESVSPPVSPPLGESEPTLSAIESPPETALGPSPANNGSEHAPARGTQSRQKVVSPPNQERRASVVSRTSQRGNQELQLDIMRAIANRAIIGVEVSVVGRTAYLDGRVATERQRRAAERAAYSVEGVGRVRNRISVNPG